MQKVKLKKHFNGWSLITYIMVILILLPSIEIILNLIKPVNENWAHIKQYMLKAYVIDSIKLTISVVLLTTIIGVLSAYFVTFYEFPLRGFFKWVLVLPMAIPPYIGAYTYNGLLSYTGIIQSTLRNRFDIVVNQKYFNIMSLKGAVFILTIFLFPYVYLITKSFLEKQSATLVESAKLLGKGNIEIFFKVIVPISRVAIVSGATLVALEVLSDYGVVSYFGVQTFTTAIFKTWFSLGDVESSVRIASILMVSVVFLILFEKFMRGRRKYSYTTTKIRPVVKKRLKGIKKNLVIVFFTLLFLLSFLIPTLQLTYFASLTYKRVFDGSFIKMSLNTLALSILAAVVITIISLIIGNYCRINEGISSKIISKITMIGYSIPAAVIAISVILLFVNIDRNLKWLYLIINPNSKTLVLSTSIFMLFFAYIIRFIGVSYQAIESGYEKMGKKFFEASRLLGKNTFKTFLKVDIPMLKPAIISSIVLVFIDIIKELPLTLLLRSFNFNTLATRTFDYAADEMLQEAAVPAIIIILISIVAISFINRVDKE
ncbi:MAG: iron transporter permease [Caloramator sp.]|jgi:iron(III) transport system permease protein|uniref:ABC transporter permease n=1 Tax=Caloramator sp. TaxID=1871330 RepID=UPI001D416535|nr:iron ABC transporter permease [Caloramator sp.]MBZ4663639.1 iron transporter permease [Caloramator sp.]